MTGPTDLLGQDYCPSCEDVPMRPSQLVCRSCDAKMPGKSRRAINLAWRVYEKNPSSANQTDYQAANKAAIEAIRAKLGKS